MLAPHVLWTARMRMTWLGLGIVTGLLHGCASSPDIEDGENDVFLTGDAKADAFGVEDWSPDGAAVLKLVTSASASKLHDDVGLSQRVADSIVAKRATLTGKKFDDLAQLDAAKYVGVTVFHHLLEYVADHHLFKTAIRVPLLVEDGDNKVALTSYNGQAKQAHVSGFARYTFVDADTHYSEKMASYDTRLQAIATKLGITIEGEMLVYAYGLSDFDPGGGVCFIGDPREVADVVGGHADDLVGDMYSIWGWRYKTTKYVDDNVENPDEELGPDWKAYKTTSANVMIVYTNDDDGSHVEADVVKPCR
jgi:hypothetical protein